MPVRNAVYVRYWTRYNLPMRLLTGTDWIRDRPWLGYALAAVFSGGALAIRLQLAAELKGFPFVTFFGAVILSAFLGGARAGALAAVLCATLAGWFFMWPAGSFTTEAPSGWIALAFFGGTSAIIIALMHGVLVAHRSQLRAAARMAGLNDELEARVAERTSALQREISERAVAEDKLRQLQKMESIGQLTGGIAHDFNNMLSIVIGSLDLALRRSEGASPALIRNIDNAMDGAKRAATLTARLLAFSRQQALAPQVLEPNQFVAQICELIRRTLGEGIEVQTILAGGLWRTCADAGELENAIINRSVNARDAMDGQGKLTIETANGHIDESYHAANSEAAVGQYVTVSVSDTGAGMSDEVRQRVFEPFYTTKEVGQGTGLGLSQVYGFVKQSGGHVQIYSEVGRGTTVKIYLPRWTGPAEAIATPAQPGEVLPRGAGEVILVVEDDDNVRAVSVEALRELGYTVIDAASPAAALLNLETDERIDLLFTDVVMPGMTGKQLAERGLVQRPALKVLYTTGYTRNAIVHQGTLDPGVALLQKPFTISQLANRVRGVLRRA